MKDGTRLRIRRALPGDAGVLGKLNAYVQQAHAAAMPDEYNPYNADAATQFFANVRDDDNHPIWIAEVDGFPVGFLEAEVRHRPCLHRRRLALLNALEGSPHGPAPSRPHPPLLARSFLPMSATSGP